jgi:WD40 repeat protein
VISNVCKLQVCFHPTKQDTLASGSTDGLINIFDVSKSCEEDALQQSLNTESSVVSSQICTALI